MPSAPMRSWPPISATGAVPTGSPTRSTLLFEPGETHETHRVTKPQDFQVLFFSPETMQQYGEEMEIAGQLHFKPAPNIDEAVYLSCKRLHEAILEEATDIELQSRLAECVGTLLTSHAEQEVPEMARPGRQPLLRARDLLFEQYAHAISLDEIAAIAGLSRFHFLKAFTAQFGLTRMPTRSTCASSVRCRCCARGCR